MSVNGIEDLPDYLAFMRTHPGEAGALLQDLLISVTNFFRDRDAFDALEAQIAGALRRQDVERRGARLGAGVRDRRGGVLDRDAAGRARANARGAADAAGLRDRSRRRARSARHARASIRWRSRPTSPRSGCAASSPRSGAATGCAASCARRCCSRIHDLLKDAPVFAHRSVQLPQPAHLSRPRCPEARHRDRPLRAAPGRAALPRRLRDRRRQRTSVPGDRQEAPDLRAAADRAPASAAAGRAEHARARARSAGAQPRRLCGPACRCRTGSCWRRSCSARRPAPASARGASCT